MNTKQRTAMIFVLLMSLAISSCAPGQLFGSTVTPTPTLTTTPTLTATPTLTETPTQRPSALPTSTLTPFFITAPNFYADSNTKPCPNYNHSIYKVEGEIFTLEGDFAIKRNSMWQLWCTGATHTWIGKLTYRGYTFTSDHQSPLQFKVTDEGYQYVGGKGTVTSPDKRTVSLGEGIALPNAIPTSNSTPTPMSMGTVAPALSSALTVWNGIPIMAGATTGLESGGGYAFYTTASRTEITAYYKQEMVRLGWSLSPDSTNLIFTKGDAFLVITVTAEGDENLVAIGLAK